MLTTASDGAAKGTGLSVCAGGGLIFRGGAASPALPAAHPTDHMDVALQDPLRLSLGGIGI